MGTGRPGPAIIYGEEPPNTFSRALPSLSGQFFTSRPCDSYDSYDKVRGSISGEREGELALAAEDVGEVLEGSNKKASRQAARDDLVVG